MSGLGWSLLGTGALSVGLAIALAFAWRRVSKTKDQVIKGDKELAEQGRVLDALNGARAELKHQVAELEKERALVVKEADEQRRRYEKRIADLSAEVEDLSRRAAEGTPAEQRRMFDKLTGGK